MVPRHSLRVSRPASSPGRRASRFEEVQSIIPPNEMDDPDFHRDHKVWSSERRLFNAALPMRDELTERQKRQKNHLKAFLHPAFRRQAGTIA